MAPDRAHPRGLRIRTRLALIVAAAVLSCVGLVAVFTVSQGVAGGSFDRALAWGEHVEAMLELQAEAERYLTAIERAAREPEQLAEIPEARAALAEASVRVLALSVAFGGDELAEGLALADAAGALCARGATATSAAPPTPALAEDVHRLYHARLEPQLRHRIEEERAGSAAATRAGRRTDRGAFLLALVAACGFMGVTLVVATILVRTIARSLTQLEAATARIANGDFEQAIGLDAGDELGRLAASFDHMQASLRGSTIHRSVLEAEVRRRTAELEAANEQLALANRGLADSEQRHRVLFDLSPVPVWVYDVDSLRIVAVNASALRLFGHDRERLLDRPVTDLTVDGRPPPTMSGGHGVATLRCADGHHVEVDVYCHEVELADRRCKLVIGVDVTEARRLEEQLRRVQKLEAIGQLAGGVAHDFNNILMVIVANATIVADALPADHPEQASLAEIQAAGERGTSLTRQLLAFGRKQPWQPVPLSLNAVAVSVERLLGRLIGEHIELVTACEPRLGAVRADVGLMEQVLTNLVVNARDAMPDGGRITVETRNLDEADVRAHSLPPGRWVALAVHDTGTGMDAATQARIFEPFFTTKAPGKGSGLGLAMVFGIVQQCDGRITVVSEPGCGSTFTIYLPAIDGAPREQTQAARRSAGGHETILVVEDDTAVRRSTTRLIGAQGYRVLEASDGAAALELLEQRGEEVALVLSDVVMPRMDGRALTLALRARHPRIKVLLMSGFARPEPGSDGSLPAPVLAKPFTVARLGEALRGALEQHAA